MIALLLLAIAAAQPQAGAPPRDSRPAAAATAELKAGTDPARLEVVLSNRGAVVTGRAVDNRGVPVGGGRLILFRADGVQSRVTDALTAKDGAFRLGPVRGGDYLIVALPSSAPVPQAGEWDRLARLAAIAQRLTLDDLDARMLDVRVVTEP